MSLSRSDIWSDLYVPPFIQILFDLLCIVPICVFLIGRLWYNKIRVRPSDPTPKPYVVRFRVDAAKASVTIDVQKKVHWDLIMSVLGSEENIKAAQFVSFADRHVHGFSAHLTKEQKEAISRNAGVIVLDDGKYVLDN